MDVWYKISFFHNGHYSSWKNNIHFYEFLCSFIAMEYVVSPILNIHLRFQDWILFQRSTSWSNFKHIHTSLCTRDSIIHKETMFRHTILLSDILSKKIIFLQINDPLPSWVSNGFMKSNILVSRILQTLTSFTFFVIAAVLQGIHRSRYALRKHMIWASFSRLQRWV